MLLLANIALSIVVIAARQDEPFNNEEDISREIDHCQSKDLKADEILSNLIKYTLPRSYKHEYKEKSKLTKKFKHIDSIMDDILAQSFTDKYNKYVSDSKDQGIRMKRARRQYHSTNVEPAQEGPVEEESHGFVKQLIPSLLPIPNYDYTKDKGNSGTIQKLPNGTHFQDAFQDLYNTSNNSNDKINSTDNGIDTNTTTEENSTNTKDDGKKDGENHKDKPDTKVSEHNRTKDDGKKDGENDENDKDKPDTKVSEHNRTKDDGKKDDKNNENDKDKTNTKDSDNDRNGKDDDTIDDNKNKTTVDPGLLDEPMTGSTVPDDSNSTVEPDVTPNTTRPNEIDTYKPDDSELNSTNSPSIDGDQNVLCTDKDHMLGINCSAYIIRLYRDDPDTNQNIAMYLKITTPLKSDMVCSNNSDILKSPTEKSVYSGHEPQNIKLVLPYYKTSPNYLQEEEMVHRQSYMYSTTPSTTSDSNPPNRTRTTVKRIVSTYQTTPKLISEQQMQLQYPNIPEATNMVQKSPELLAPLRHVTPRSPSIQKQTQPNNLELSDRLRYKLKQLAPLLNNLLASKIREELQNSAKQNIPNPKSTYSGKMPTLNNHKDRRISPDKNTVFQESNLRKYRPELYQFRSKDDSMPKPDHFPGVISGFRKKDGTTFFDYFPFYNTPLSKRMKRHVATSKSHNFFMFVF